LEVAEKCASQPIRLQTVELMWRAPLPLDMQPPLTGEYTKTGQAFSRGSENRALATSPERGSPNPG
jgi:hypothetical protein